MFASSQDKWFHDIDPVRPAMTFFAYQILAHEAVLQAEISGRPEFGLHVHIPT